MNEQYHNELAAGIEVKYRKLEDAISEDIVRRIKKANKITSAADWQLNRLLIIGNSSEDIQKIISSAVGDNQEEVERLYAEVIENEYTYYKKQYEDINGEFIPYEENLQLQQLTEALVRQSSEELSNLTRSMGFMVDMGLGKKVYTPLSQIYNDYLDQAVLGVASGAFDYNTMIRKVCKDLTDSGLRVDTAFKTNSGDMSGVQYPSGWHNRIDVAARRSVLTGLNQLSGQVMQMNSENLGCDTFEVSWHVGARPEHAAWQGKVYTKRQLETICGLGTGGGLQGWNCRHTYYLFFPGSKRTYTDEWLEAQNQKEAKTKYFRGREYNTYQATQKQRSMETNMRAQRNKVKLMQAGGADPDDITLEKCKYQAQLDEYKSFSKTFNLPEQRERIYYDRKGRVAPSTQTYRKYQAEQAQKAAARAEAKRRKDIDTASTKVFRNISDGAIINAQNLQRTSTNTGAFSVYPEKMSKKHIREIADKYDIDIKGLTLNIDTNEELMALPITGEAVPESIGKVTFFPNAFTSEEEIIRTIVHEKEHVRQFKEYGVEYVQNNHSRFEKLAYRAEDEYIDRLKAEGKL